MERRELGTTPIDIFRDVNFSNTGPTGTIATERPAQHPECRPITQPIRGVNVWLLEPRFHRHSSAHRRLKISPQCLNASRGPARSWTTTGMESTDVEIAIALEHIIRAARHHLDLAGAPVRGTAGTGVCSAGVVEPITAVDGTRTIELIAPNEVPLDRLRPFLLAT